MGGGGPSQNTKLYTLSKRSPLGYLEEFDGSIHAGSRAFSKLPFSLTETIDNLQTHIDELQRQVEELKTSGQSHVNYERSEQPKSVQSFPCLKELYDLRK